MGLLTNKGLFESLCWHFTSRKERDLTARAPTGHVGLAKGIFTSEKPKTPRNSRSLPQPPFCIPPQCYALGSWAPLSGECVPEWFVPESSSAPALHIPQRNELIGWVKLFSKQWKLIFEDRELLSLSIQLFLYIRPPVYLKGNQGNYYLEAFFKRRFFSPRNEI